MPTLLFPRSPSHATDCHWNQGRPGGTEGRLASLTKSCGKKYIYSEPGISLSFIKLELTMFPSSITDCDRITEVMQFEVGPAFFGGIISAGYTSVCLDHIISWVTFSFLKLWVYFLGGFCTLCGVAWLIPWPQSLILLVFSYPISTLLHALAC